MPWACVASWVGGIHVALCIHWDAGWWGSAASQAAGVVGRPTCAEHVGIGRKGAGPLWRGLTTATALAAEVVKCRALCIAGMHGSTISWYDHVTRTVCAQWRADVYTRVHCWLSADCLVARWTSSPSFSCERRFVFAVVMAKRCLTDFIAAVKWETKDEAWDDKVAALDYRVEGHICVRACVGR